MKRLRLAVPRRREGMQVDQDNSICTFAIAQVCGYLGPARAHVSRQRSPSLARGCRSAMSDRLGCPLRERACPAAIASSDIQEPLPATVAIQHFDEAGLDSGQRRGLISSFAAVRIQTTALQRVSGMVFSLARQAVRRETGKTTEGQTKLTLLGKQGR